MFMFLTICAITFSTLANGARYYRPHTPDYLKCQYGKYFKDIGQQPTCNPFGQSCPPGYYCGAGPADQPGFCCKSDNPCKLGNPFTRNGDAPHCLGKSGIRCPKGYSCVGTKTSSSVCCKAIKGCPGPNGKIYKVGESFKDDCNTCQCRSDGQVICTLIACPIRCTYNGKRYSPGDRFRATDGCNTCTCEDNGSVSCTEIGCGYGK